MEFKKNRNPSYKFTADMDNPVDRFAIRELRQDIKDHNARSDNTLRVEIRGRVQYNKTTPSHLKSGNIVGGLKNARIVDVYVYDR